MLRNKMTKSIGFLSLSLTHTLTYTTCLIPNMTIIIPTYTKENYKNMTGKETEVALCMSENFQTFSRKSDHTWNMVGEEQPYYIITHTHTLYTHTHVHAGP